MVRSARAALTAPRRILAGVGLLLLAASPALAQATAAQARPLPMDDAVLQGELENGLRYFVQTNGRPEARAELRLVINVGSVLEDDSQQGLAHLLEHMAFNGTESFEKQELVDYLESIGMAFGPSINASTSFDETIYMLRVPTDEPGPLATGLQILEEWAHKVTLDPEEVDKERGVVIEEWRLGRGAGARISDQQLPVILEGSRYASRLPIGDIEVLQTFPQAEIERFYETWYRPDLMAVVAVGDFDAAEVEGMIRERFSQIPVPSTPIDRPVYDVPVVEGTRFALATDPELTQGQIGMLSLQEPSRLETVVDLRNSLIEQFASVMLNQRMAELTQRPDPPFLGAGSGRGGLVRTAALWQLNAGVSEQGHQEGFEAILREAERAARFGFGAGELERNKASLLRAFERSYDERENRTSAGIAGQYVNHALYGSVVLSPEVQWELIQALVPTITVEDVNAVARRNLDPDNRIIVASGIDKPEVELPTPAALTAALDQVAQEELEPWEDEVSDAPLVAAIPEPGRIVAESELPVVGVTEWTLSNGAKVWLKPTDLKDDEIVFAGTSPGGWSLSSEEDHLTATNATSFVGQGGLGAFSAIELQKAMAGISAGAGVSVGELHERGAGSASPKDLETLFQLTWLRFTEPRADEQVVAAMKQQIEAVLANRNASPTAAFSDTLSAVLSQGHPRAAPPSAEALSAIDLDDALEFYRERFADGGDFHFFFVGAFELDQMRPLVEQWLASLPSVEGEEQWRDLDMDPPTGRIEKVVRRGLEPQSQTAIVLTGPFESTAHNRVRIRALTDVLELRLRETLREDLGGTYSVGVSAGYEQFPEGRYTISIQFGADPDRAEELKAAVFAEIDRLIAEGPDPLDVEKAAEGARRAQETNMESNGWWATQLRLVVENGSDPANLQDFTRFDEITSENVQSDAGRYLGTENVVIVSLLPERPIG